MKFGFEARNNEIEYEALIARIRLAKDIGAEKLEVFSDSMLVVQQLNGQYEAKGERMIQYLQHVRAMTSEFLYWSINKIPRAANSEAGKLVR